MRVMAQSPDPLARMHTMTKRQGKTGTIDVKAVLAEDEEFLRALVRAALQEVLEAEMTEAVGVEKGERTEAKQHCQNRRLPYLARRRIFTDHSGGQGADDDGCGRRTRHQW